MTFSVIVKHKKEKKILHIDLTYSFTKAIKHIFIHCCLLYNQAFRFNRKRLKQIATFSAECQFNFSVMVHTTELNYS